jgi:eukaryotic-like serine/threonine-protein kinase
LINQGQLVAAFQAWTLDKGRSLADQLLGRGDLDAKQRAGVETTVALHVKKHGNVEKSLAAVPAGKSTRKSLARLGDTDIDGTLGHVASGNGSTQGDDRYSTISESVGLATSDGQRSRILRLHARSGPREVDVAFPNDRFAPGA